MCFLSYFQIVLYFALQLQFSLMSKSNPVIAAQDHNVFHPDQTGSMQMSTAQWYPRWQMLFLLDLVTLLWFAHLLCSSVCTLS